MKTVTFFSNNGGVGRTSLVYHLAWAFHDLGVSVVAADLDPQANLSSMFLDESQLEDLWKTESTVLGSIKPLIAGLGDAKLTALCTVADRLELLAGDLRLSRFEDALSETWPKCISRDERSFRVQTAFYRVLHEAAESIGANLVLVDVGPSLGAINRSALVASDYVIVPLAPDLFSLQGLRNLGPALDQWRDDWQQRRSVNPVEDLLLPSGSMTPAGYIVMQHAVRLDRPVKAYRKWAERIPGVYHEEMLHSAAPTGQDGECLMMLKHYRSLMPLAQDARKPVFHLKPADGALGAHLDAVESSRDDFHNLARQVARAVDMDID